MGCFVVGYQEKEWHRGHAVALLPSSCFPDAEFSAYESSVLWFY